MYQHSNLPVHKYFETALVDSTTWDATSSENPELRQLGTELYYERCLNRLSLRLNQLVIDYLTHLAIPPARAGSQAVVSESLVPDQVQLEPALTSDITAQITAQILAQLLQELSQVLPDQQFAVLQPVATVAGSDRPPLQPSTTSSEPLCHISHCITALTPSPDSQITWQLPSGQSVRLQHGATLTRQTLHQLQVHRPQSLWKIGDDADPIGWFLIHPSPTQTTDATCETSLPLLLAQFIERSINQCAVTLHQIRLIQKQQQQQQALIAQTEELQQTNQLKSEFLANTSHEIRTPLSSILGFTHLLKAQGFSPTSLRHQEYLNIILTSGQHLLAVINDILDLSKIEANQLDLQQEPVNVPNICQMAITLVREKANDKGLQLQLTIAPTITTLIADPLRLKQMLFNLLSNAIKFTLRGSVGLEVTTAGEFLQFCVWDTGTGISNEQQRLLFRPYSQIANTAVGQDTGTGLGLALTQKLAELHGGSVAVFSEIDRGSRFTISLPLKSPPHNTDCPAAPAPMPEPHAPAQPATTTPQAQPVTTKTRRSPRRQQKSTTPQPTSVAPKSTPSSRILLVEDNIHNAKLMVTFLSKLSYEVTWVQDGREMWQALERSRPALILMDVHLPGEDGLSLTRHIRNDERYQTIPIIAQTALAMKGDRDLCLEAGAVDYISKPIDLDALAQLVATYVTGHSS